MNENPQPSATPARGNESASRFRVDNRADEGCKARDRIEVQEPHGTVVFEGASCLEQASLLHLAQYSSLLACMLDGKSLDMLGVGHWSAGLLHDGQTLPWNHLCSC